MKQMKVLSITPTDFLSYLNLKTNPQTMPKTCNSDSYRYIRDQLMFLNCQIKKKKRLSGFFQEIIFILNSCMNNELSPLLNQRFPTFFCFCFKKLIILQIIGNNLANLFHSVSSVNILA